MRMGLILVLVICRVDVLSDWRAMADAVTDDEGLASKGTTSAANLIQIMCACAWKATGSDLIPGRNDGRCVSSALAACTCTVAPT